MSTPGKPDTDNPNPAEDDTASTPETPETAETAETPETSETSSTTGAQTESVETAPSDSSSQEALSDETNAAEEAAENVDNVDQENPEQHPSSEPPAIPPLPTRQTVPGGIFGLVVLLLVASIIGGLIVSLWQGSGTGRPSQTAGNLDNRLASAESEIAGLKTELAETRNRAKAIETFMQSQDGAAVSEGTLDGLTELQNRIDALDEDIAGLKAQAAVPQAAVPPPAATSANASGDAPGAAAALNALRERIDTVKTEITGRIAALEETAPPTDLEQTLDSLAPKADVAALQERIDAIEQDNSGNEAKQAATALSLANLSRAIQSGQAFNAELETLQMLAPDISLPEGLDKTAATGVPTKDQLTAQFTDLAYTALQAGRTQQNTDWWSQLQSNFDTVFSVRRTGEVEGDTTEAILARTEQRLKAGNLAAAVEELSAIDGKAADIVAPWRTDATARLKLNDFVEQLNNSVVEHLSQGGLNP